MCTQLSRDRVGSNCLRCQTNRRRLNCVYHMYTDDLLWQNFLSPQCRNCSRDPDHAHLGSTHSSQDKDFTWQTRVQNLKSLALAVAEILHGVQNSKTGYLTLTTPLSGKIFLRQGGTCYGRLMYQIRSL